MIDPEFFAQRMGLLGDRIGRVLAGPTLKEYHAELSAALTTEEFVAATVLAFKSWNAEYRNWPSPGQLIEYIKPIAAPTLSALEAYEKVLRICGDPYDDKRREKIQVLGATTVRAFRAAGGLRSFSGVLTEDESFLRSRFVKAYEHATENADAELSAGHAIAAAGERVAGLVDSVAKARALPERQPRQLKAPSDG